MLFPLSADMESFHELQLPNEVNVSSFDSLATDGVQLIFTLTYNQVDSKRRREWTLTILQPFLKYSHFRYCSQIV